MAHRMYQLLFTADVKAAQETDGSRGLYARYELPEAPARDRLTDREAGFISARDSFYMASVSATGWPYVQHRGGSRGFLKVIDASTIGFAEYKGNRQYISLGNFSADPRVSIILMDYKNRQRLKLLGHARVVDRHQEPERLQALASNDEEAPGRGIVISLMGFDWNCPKYITPRLTFDELATQLEPLTSRIHELEAENARLRLMADPDAI